MSNIIHLKLCKMPNMMEYFNSSYVYMVVHVHLMVYSRLLVVIRNSHYTFQLRFFFCPVLCTILIYKNTNLSTLYVQKTKKSKSGHLGNSCLMLCLFWYKNIIGNRLEGLLEKQPVEKCTAIVKFLVTNLKKKLYSTTYWLRCRNTMITSFRTFIAEL